MIPLFAALSLALCLPTLATVYCILSPLFALITAEWETMTLLTDRPFSRLPGPLSFLANVSPKWPPLFVPAPSVPQLLTKQNGRPGYLQIRS